MAELNFPANPQMDEEYAYGNLLYKWDGYKWTTWGTGANAALDLKNDLATTGGASMVGTASGLTVQEELDMAGTGGSALEPIRRSYAEAGFDVDISESFMTGATLDAANQVLLGDGQIGYSWGGAFPKEVPPNSSPADTGGIGSTAWIDQSNNLLRTQAKTYVDNADANLQGQLNNKSDVSHTHTPAAIGAAPAVHTHTPSEAGAAPAVHGHAIADVSGLQGALDGKSPIGHTHTPAEAGAAPVVHTHAIADVSGLQGALDGKSATGHTHTPAEVGAVAKSGDTMTGVLTTPDVYITSDKRLKTNLIAIEGTLDRVCTLTAFKYDKATAIGDMPSHREIGLIADAVQEVFPLAVNEVGPDAIKTISSSAMIAVLVEAIKELKAEIEEMKHGRT